jgi:hypothetical protein
MNTDQPYVHTCHTTNDQFTFAQNGNYPYDQVSLQHWHNNNGQSIKQMCKMPANHFAPPFAGQQLFHHQQQLLQQQYVTSNQGMQQCMPPLMGQKVMYQ